MHRNFRPWTKMWAKREIKRKILSICCNFIEFELLHVQCDEWKLNFGKFKLKMKLKKWKELKYCEFSFQAAASKTYATQTTFDVKVSECICDTCHEFPIRVVSNDERSFHYIFNSEFERTPMKSMRLTWSASRRHRLSREFVNENMTTTLSNASRMKNKEQKQEKARVLFCFGFSLSVWYFCVDLERTWLSIWLFSCQRSTDSNYVDWITWKISSKQFME